MSYIKQQFIELAAIRVIGAWGHDVSDGKLTIFRRAVQATPASTPGNPVVEVKA